MLDRQSSPKIRVAPKSGISIIASGHPDAIVTVRRPYSPVFFAKVVMNSGNLIAVLTFYRHYRIDGDDEATGGLLIGLSMILGVGDVGNFCHRLLNTIDAIAILYTRLGNTEFFSFSACSFNACSLAIFSSMAAMRGALRHVFRHLASRSYE